MFRPRRKFMAITVAGVLGVAGNTFAYAYATRTHEKMIPGVQTFKDLSQRHTSDHVVYPQTPPVGGPHAPLPLNCGMYPAPVPAENAVHSLEHGAVWITYRPDLPAVQVKRLRDIVSGRSHLLLSPFPLLPSPVVVSAWGRQLRLGSAWDSRLPTFIRVYRGGPQTPELGAPCSGGAGTPGG